VAVAQPFPNLPNPTTVFHFEDLNIYDKWAQYCRRISKRFSQSKYEKQLAAVPRPRDVAGYIRGVADGSVVMRYDVAALGNPIATFREKITASYSEFKISKINSPHWILKCVATTASSSSSSSSSSYICRGVGPLVDPFRSHVSRSLFKGLP
jgi:hypothetical protein